MRLVAIALVLLSAVPAWSEEPRGCDKFAWPIAAEQAALTAASRQQPADGDLFDRTSEIAIAVPLAPLAEAKLTRPPERAPKHEDARAGVVSFAAAAGGRYRVSLSEAGWIDVIQGGQYLTPTAFTGALDCAGIRKSVEFAIAPGPFVLQVSDVTAPSIALVLTPAQ